MGEPESTLPAPTLLQVTPLQAVTDVEVQIYGHYFQDGLELFVAGVEVATHLEVSASLDGGILDGGESEQPSRSDPDPPRILILGKVILI